MFNPGSSFFVGLGELIVNGTVNLNGATLSGTAGLNLGGGWMIIILSPGGLTGTFNGLPDGALFETSFGNQFVRVNYLNGVTLSATQPVPNVVLTASANPSLAGLPVTFTFGATAPISGAATPSGLVTFTDGLSTLGIAYLNPSGIATLTTASLSPGTHTIAAAYSGDTRFAFASANLIQTVINLIPTITNLSQTLLPEGSQALVLTVLGSSFIPNSIVRLNSGPLTTAFVSSTQLQATIPAAALIDEATFTVTVFNPGLGGGASNGLTVGVGESPLPDGTRGTPNQRAVAELYGDLLGRTADAAGLAGWSGLLDRNGTVAQVVAGITGSLEYRTNLVQGLYRQYLQRAADSSGLATGLAFLQSGGRVEQLAAFITGSQEYFQIRVGGSNDGFLAALYHDVLNRDIDSSGQISFGQALVSGTSRSQVASAIFGSDEYRGDLVQSFYQRFLDRSTDSGGLSNWLGVLKNGATDEQVIAGLIGSAEYFNKTAP